MNFKDSTAAESNSCIGRSDRMVIPVELREHVLHMAHQGHHGIVWTKQVCRASVWWLKIDADVEHFIKRCEACLLSGKSTTLPQPPQQITDTPTNPWKSLQRDICGEFKAAPHHQRFLIVLIDKFSK